MLHPHCDDRNVVLLHRQAQAVAARLAARRLGYAKTAQASTEEAACLRGLNAALRALGHGTGQVVEVEGHIYRVVTVGNPAVSIGQLPPGDDDAPCLHEACRAKEVAR